LISAALLTALILAFMSFMASSIDMACLRTWSG
jgi:hypothetical protein